MTKLTEGVPLKLFCLLGAASIGFAWWFPGSWISFALTWIAAFSFVVLAHSKHSLRALFVCGLIVQCLGFYWLIGTIHNFGNFPLSAAISIFALFAFGSSLQFLFFGILHRYLPKELDILSLRAPLAWIAVELAAVRIFPWHLGHTLIASTPLVQLADITGSIGLSFLVIWIAEGAFLLRTKRLGLPIATLALIASLGYGFSVIENYTDEGEQFEAVLVQGNIPLYAINDKASPREDIKKHFELSSEYDKPNTLIIWPETAVMYWVFTGLSHQNQDARLPRYQNASLLTGSLMYQTKEQLFNSAFSVSPDGELGKPYHKRVLMPYGEYTPFGETFPWMKEINSTAGDFIRGEGPALHLIKLTDDGTPLKVSTLICYEDVVQGLAAEAVRAGAEVLVNLTNDAWFGDSLAPHQHHLIASFRAIENKRYHLRATNTGKTAIVHPLGNTLGSLPTYSEGALSQVVSGRNQITLFSHYQNTPWWILTLLTCLVATWGILRKD